MIVPYVYQAMTIPKARKALREKKRALVVMATALGKTITSALIWRGFVKPRGVFFAHTVGILDEAIKDYAKVYGNKVKLALYNGRSKNIEGADIVFATFQSMSSNLKRFSRNYFAWMTVDEGHHSQAETFREVIEHFTCPRLAITATPDRTDMLDIRELFGDEVVNISLEEAIARNWLPEVEYHVVTDQSFDEHAFQRILKEVLEEGKRLSIQEINRRVFIKARDEKVAEIIEGYEQKTLIFCQNIRHAKNFRRYLHSVEEYHSDQSRQRNKDVLDDLRNGLILRVLGVNGLNEGINVPDVEVLVFYRTTESETIFKQQLGRGMRPPKLKLIVLDFVGNVHRILMLREMIDKIDHLRKKYGSTKGNATASGGNRMHVSGTGFDFTFSDIVIDLMRVVERVNADFYPTWQEASAATQALAVTSSNDYTKKYRKDHMLPGDVPATYADFPGWDIFLGKSRAYFGNWYETWQEAGAAAQWLGMKSSTDYLVEKGYKQDPRLPSDPSDIYEDFPGWAVFLGGQTKEFYPTWQEAGVAAVRLGLTNSPLYTERYKEDERLPSTPHVTYENFPGWAVFLGGNAKDLYPTWPEASVAAKPLGAKTGNQYRDRYKGDPRLPSNPNVTYTDFPGWKKFLQTDLYPTWEEAATAAKNLGIRNSSDYLRKKIHKKDPRLPSQPGQFYTNFPGWPKFLGEE